MLNKFVPGFAITVFGAEAQANYNRILLSPVLAGEKTIDEIMLNDEHGYMDRGILLEPEGLRLFFEYTAKTKPGRFNRRTLVPINHTDQSMM